MTGLPAPKDLGYFEARDAAALLEGLAHDLSQGYQQPVIGFREAIKRRERNALLSSIRFRAMAYRRRANELRGDGQ